VKILYNFRDFVTYEELILNSTSVSRGWAYCFETIWNAERKIQCTLPPQEGLWLKIVT